MSSDVFAGSAFMHPNAERIDKQRGSLSEQSDSFRDGIGAIRMGLMRHDVGYAPIPRAIELIMDGNTLIHGARVIEGTSVNPKTGDVRFLLTYRENRSLHWTIVEISHDTIVATQFRNPVDELLIKPGSS